MEEPMYGKVDWQKLFSALWKKKLWIGLTSILCAVLLAGGAFLFVTPQYQSDILVYINNNSIARGGSSLTFSSGELTAARLLLDSYVVALKSRACLDAVKEKAHLDYTRSQLDKMIVAEPVNDTEWFIITVVAPDPSEAKLIANTIADVLPEILRNTIEGSSVEIVDFAIQPSGQVSPDLPEYCAIGFFIGLLLTCGKIAVHFVLDDKIHGEDTLSEISNTIPVLVNVPHFSSKNNSSKRGFRRGNRRGGKRGSPIDTAYNDSSICDDLDFTQTEAYNLLQTSVQYSFAENGGCKVIGITSSERNEGKSTLAINLAYSLSCDKQKVLLLEGDMRLPSIAKKLGLESAPGLSDYLTGKAKDSGGIQYSAKAPSLSVVCAGVVPPNPFRLLGSSSMERLLEAFKEAFDYIIVDLPPVNIVSDPLSIAKYLDGFIVVTRSEFTTKQGVRDVVKKLQVVNANILGFVVNVNETSSGNIYGKYAESAEAYGNSTARAAKKNPARAKPPVSLGSNPRSRDGRAVYG